MDKSAVELRIPSLKKLMEVGREKGYLLYDEICELLPDEILSLPDELEEIYRRLDVMGIGVIDRPGRYMNRDEHGAGEVDFEAAEDEGLDLSLSDQEKVSDPVRMYFREMGTIPLLDRAGEVDIARRIEEGERLVYQGLAANPIVLGRILRLPTRTSFWMCAVRRTSGRCSRPSSTSPSSSARFRPFAVDSRSASRVGRPSRSWRGRSIGWWGASPASCVVSIFRCRRSTSSSAT
jgi:hypothetical protein